MATIYLSKSDRGVTISNYSIEDDRFENNHVNLVDEDRPRADQQEGTYNIIRNILGNAGIDIVHE